MRARLQEQRIGDDGADRSDRERARDHVFRAVQQGAHQETTLGFRFHRSRLGATAAARGLVIIGNSLRHFSSPEGVGPLVPIATPASASRYCLTVAPAA